MIKCEHNIVYWNVMDTKSWNKNKPLLYLNQGLGGTK